MFIRWFGRALALIGLMMIIQSLIWMSAGVVTNRQPGDPAQGVNGVEEPAPTPSSEFTPTPPPTRTPTSTPTPTFTPLPPTSTPTPAFPARWAISPTPRPAASGGSPEGIPEPRPPLAFPPRRVNLLLLGSDRRPEERLGRTDTIIFASIDPDGPSVRLLSIPRDLWVYIPGWGFNKVNTAYVHGELVRYPGGGYGLLQDTLRYNLGLTAHGYALVDFEGMRTIIDTLGGVDVNVRCPLYDVFPDPDNPAITGTLSLPVPGRYHLDGKQALWYMRSRYSTGDFDRSRRQQQVLEGLLDRLKEGGWLLRVPSLWSGIRQTVQTDLGLEEVLWLASIGVRLDRSRIARGWLHPVLASGTISTTAENGLFVYLPTEQAYSYLERFLLGPLPSEASPIARVEVINASGNPLYGEMAGEILREAGFQVVRMVEAAPDGRPTRVIAMSSAGSSTAAPGLLRALRLPGARLEISPEPGAEAPYRVWLGADFNPCIR
ncbi:Putative transcriptional regulator YvhJ [Candidatus Thermoflexus japonica]|uniref:Transcriptional regulator YvhJ n=1 Tax=Candidatus Thermoflexus japonica TaxID=2035417 RepID=A0A2H5Y711_9CHLR|nr:Putative transcriptional regulator YvhJ [Candidatus Thermoflexus japonica]